MVVAFEEVVIGYDAGVWAQSAEVAPGWFGDDEGRPACVVGVVLRDEAGADGVEAVGTEASDVLGVAGGVCQGQRDGETDEVDVGYVDEELRAVEGEFAEIPGCIDVGVGGVGYGWFDETWAWIQKECEGLVDGEPDSTSS